MKKISKSPSNHQEGLERERRHFEKLEARRRFETCGAPQRHRVNAASVTNKQWQAVYDKLRSRLGEGMIYCLSGGRGRGKTQMATNLLQAASGDRRGVRYTTEQHLYDCIKRSFNAGYGEHTQHDIIKMYGSVGLLVIDEIQQRSSNEWRDQIKEELIDTRYGKQLDTLLLTNLKPDAAIEALGSSIASRMQECGGIIECGWASFRGQA